MMEAEEEFEGVDQVMECDRASLLKMSHLSVKDLSDALLVASRRGNSQQIEWFLDAGAKLSSEDEFGYTPLMFAALQGLSHSVDRMLAVPGCIVNRRNHMMQTALHLAASKGQSKTIETLIKANSMVNAADDWGETPLIAAVKCGSIETVQVLLNNGARMEMIDLQGFNALTHTARLGYSDVMKLLIDHGCSTWKVLKTSPLHQAATFGHVTCVNVLLSCGVSQYIRDIHGVLPIELATQTDQATVVTRLLEDGTTIENQNATVAAAAKYNGTKSMVALLEHGASPDATDMQGVPAFFTAISENNVSIIKSMIQYNVNLNRAVSRVYFYNTELRDLFSTQLDDSVCPVMVAALSGHGKIVKILVYCGAKLLPFCKLMELNLLPSGIVQDGDLLSWLLRRCFTPCSLTDQCRLVIRSMLGKMVPEKVTHLPLPKPIQDYVNFNELDKF